MDTKTTVKNHNGKTFTLDQLLDICTEADVTQVDFSGLIDDDLATVPCIIRDLVNRVKAYESCGLILDPNLAKTMIEDKRWDYETAKNS